MAKNMALPDVGALGQERQVRAAPPVLKTDAGTAAPKAELSAAQDIERVAMEFNAAGERIQKREDAVERAQATSDHEEALAGKVRRMVDEGGISGRDAVANFRKVRDELTETTMKGLKGSENLRALVQVDLSRINASWFDKVAVLNITAGKEMVADKLLTNRTKTANAISEAIAADPYNPAIVKIITDKINGHDDFVKGFADAQDENTNRDIRRVDKEALFVSAVTDLFEQGNVGGAEEALKSIKKLGLEGIVSQEKTGPISKRIAARKDAELKVSRDILNKAKTTAAVLSNPELRQGMTRAEAANVLGASTGQPTGILNTNAQLAIDLMEKNVPVEQVRKVLDSSIAATKDPETRAALEAIKASLPGSLEDYQRAKGDAEIAESQPGIEALVKQGVDRKVATMMKLGGNVNIAVPSTKLTPAQLTDLQADIRAAKDARNILTDIIPNIDDDVVGIWGFLRDAPAAGIATQIGGIKQVAGLVGFSEEKVRKARLFRADIRQSVGILSRFITRKGTRLSNEDREFAMRASAALDAANDAGTVASILTKLMNTANKATQEGISTLETGEISDPNAMPPEVVISEDEDGVTRVRDMEGNTIQEWTEEAVE